MAGRMHTRAMLLVLVFLSASFSGCFGENEVEKVSSANDVVVTPAVLSGGVFQGLTITAQKDLSAFIPYLILNDDTGYVQNSTVVDLESGDSVLLNVLAPPRTDTAIVLIGDYGRENWPVRYVDESWKTWYNRDGYDLNDNPGITRIMGINGSIDTVTYSNDSGGSVIATTIPIKRQMAAAYSGADGGRHSMGVVDGRTTFNYLNMLSDESADPTDAADGAIGYLDRWAGQGNLAYEDAAQYLIQTLENFGLEVITQRFVYDSIQTGAQNPEAYNICGYRFGSEDPNKWMVF